MSSDEDEAGLMAAFKKGGKPVSQTRKPSFTPGLFFSEDSSGSEKPSPKPARRVAVAVKVSPPKYPLDEYTYYEPKDEVRRILREYYQNDAIMYEVKLSNGKTQQVSAGRVDELLSSGAGL
jgi:hypothetical protein